MSAWGNSQFCPHHRYSSAPGCGRPGDGVRWGEGRDHPEQRAGSVCRAGRRYRCLCRAPAPSWWTRQTNSVASGWLETSSPGWRALSGRSRPRRSPGESSSPTPGPLCPRGWWAGMPARPGGVSWTVGTQESPRAPEAGSRQHLSGSAATGRTTIAE